MKLLKNHGRGHVIDDLPAAMLEGGSLNTASPSLSLFAFAELRDPPDAEACDRFDKATKQGKDMDKARRLLCDAVASVNGEKEKRAVASLFTPGGTHAMQGEFAGVNDFKVFAYLVILPEANV